MTLQGIDDQLCITQLSLKYQALILDLHVVPLEAVVLGAELSDVVAEMLMHAVTGHDLGLILHGLHVNLLQLLELHRLLFQFLLQVLSFLVKEIQALGEGI